MRRFTFVALLLVLLAASAAAQSQYGTVAGAVVDNDRQPLPGVAVTLAGPYMQGERTAVTDASGWFRFVLIPPGEGYTLKFALDGFNTLEQQAVVINVGRETRFDAVMSPSQYAETITVTAERIVVDTSKSTVDATFEWNLLDDLSTQRHFNTIWYMTPGVPVAGQNNPSVHGAGGDDNAVLIDGVDTTDPRTGTWGTQINWDTIQEAQVQTGGYLAEFGRATGGVMNLVTKSGGNEFHLTARGVWRDSEWGSDPGFEKETGKPKAGQAAETELRPNITVGGPILRDKLWFYAGYEQRDRDRSYAYYATQADQKAGVSTPIISNYKGHQASVKLTFQAGSSHSLVAYYNEDPIDITNVTAISGAVVSTAAEAMNTQYQGGNNYSAQWYGVLTPSFLMDAKYQLHQQELNQDTMGPGFNEIPRFLNRTTGYAYGAAQSIYDSKRDRQGLLVTGSYFLDTEGGGHQLKAGLEWLSLEPEAGSTYNAAGYYRTTGATTPVPNSRYLWTDQVGAVPNTDTYYAIFVQDAWRIGNLTLNLGVRAEQWEAETNVGDSVAKFSLGEQIAPRLGFAYDLNGNSLHGSLSRFYDMPTNYIGSTMSFTPTRQKYYTWKPGAGCPTDAVDPNWWQAPDSCWTLSSDVFLRGRGWAVDPSLDPIYVDELTIGYDHRLSDRFAIGATYIWREQPESIEDIDPEYDQIRLWTNGPLDHVIVKDGREFNTDDPWKEYQAIELSFKKRFGSDGFQFAASYSYVFASKGWLSTGGSGAATPYSQYSGYGDQPDAFDTLWYGEQQSPHTFKAFGSYTAPWKMVFGVSTFWNSGFLYTRGRTGTYGTVPLEELGTSEVGNNWEADIHVEQPVTLGPVQLALYFDALNVFDNQQPTSRGGNPAVTSSYNLPTGWQTPRAFVIGFKVEY